MTRARWTALAITVATAATTLLTAGPAAGLPGPAASSSPATGSAGQAGNPFYLPPDPLPAGANGSVIRQEPMHLALSVPVDGAGHTLPATATRMMYRSTDTHDRPTAVTGTYLEPSTPWTGRGERPLVAVAPGTQGQGDQCAPSKLLDEGIHFTAPLDVTAEYEYLTAYALLARGIAVVMTDYHGLGTPDMHDYINRKAEGHAVLDSVRAARNLGGTSLRPGSPVGLSGYSQGAGAAGSAAEMAPEYAPEMTLSGSYLIAPPADLHRVVEAQAFANGPFGRGGLGIGALGYIGNGLLAEYPETRPAIDAALNDSGRELLHTAGTTCLPELAMRYAFHDPREYTSDGRSVFETLLHDPRIDPVLREQTLGRSTPTSPIRIVNSVADDVVPWGQARQLAVDWCGRGADVDLVREDLPWVLPASGIGHVLDWLPALVQEGDWFVRRFEGAAFTGNCGALPA